MTALTDQINEVLIHHYGSVCFGVSSTEVAERIAEALQLDEVQERLRNAVNRIYANVGPSPVLVELRRAMALLSATEEGEP